MLPGSVHSIRLPVLGIRMMCGYLREQAVDPAPLLRAVGLSEQAIEDPWGTVSGIQEIEFERQFVSATRHLPGAAYEVGRRYKLFIYGPVALASLTSATVDAALRQFISLQALGYSILEYALERYDEGHMTFYASDHICPEDLHAFVHERALGSVPLFFNDLFNRRLPLHVVDSVLERPANWEYLEQQIGAPIRFAASRTQFVISEQVMAEPLPAADAMLSESYRALCVNQLRMNAGGDRILEDLRSFLKQPGGFDRPAIEAARALGVSERSLHRHLSQRGVSYGTLVADSRLRLAQRMLAAEEHHLQEISDRLGFSELSAFSRFFRRQTGSTPSSYRRKLKAM